MEWNSVDRIRVDHDGSEKNDNEKPVHKVKLQKGFYIGIYEVTQNNMKNNGIIHPYVKVQTSVETVSWDDAVNSAKNFKKEARHISANRGRINNACRQVEDWVLLGRQWFDGKYAGVEIIVRWKHIISTRNLQMGLYDMIGTSGMVSDWYESGYPLGEQVDPKVR